jgi:hypothetical protein
MLDALAWFGTSLEVASYTQRTERRLRTISLASGALLLCFYLIRGLWPLVALELVVAAINVYRLARGEVVTAVASRTDRPTAAASIHPASTI